MRTKIMHTTRRKVNTIGKRRASPQCKMCAHTNLNTLCILNSIEKEIQAITEKS